MNADTFVHEMETWKDDFQGRNYGQHILSLWETLTDDEREECLKEGRSKYICSAVEGKCMEKEVPDEYTTDLRQVMKVIKSCPLAFPPLYVETWTKLPRQMKKEMLEAAELGLPCPATSGKRKWLNLSGLIYTVIVGVY